MLNTSPNLSDRSDAINILMLFPQSAEAIKSLIDILDFNFHSLAVGKEVVTDKNELFRKKITNALNAMTKQSLKANKEKWLEYYNNNYNLKLILHSAYT